MTRSWLDRHWRDLLVVVAGLAIALRMVLVVNGPAYGYVWDFYQDGVARLYTQGHLPLSTDCWQCYHPPLFYWLGWPFYAVGAWISPGDAQLSWRLLAGESLLATGVIVYYATRLLRLVGCRGPSLAAGVSLLLMTPILFFSSDGPDADVLVAALLTGVAFHATRVFGRRGAIRPMDAAGLGVLTGLAMAAKFSGLVALALVGALIVSRVPDRRHRTSTLRAGVIVVLLSVAIGGWKYVDNARRYGTPLFANGSAAEGFAGTRHQGPGSYEFLTIRLGALRGLFGRGAPPGQLTDFPVYRSVITTLHAQVWSDMSLFSVRTRHGAPDNPYRTRAIPAWLTMSVVVLGFVPEALALLGVVISARRRLLRPLLVCSAITVLAYVWWFLPQERWALKAKYLLVLLPVGVVYALVGQAWLSRRWPRAAAFTTALLVALGVVAYVYMFVFAVAR